MENSDVVGLNNEKTEESSSYRYWVREATSDAAPPPLPKKLTPQEIHINTQSNSSVVSLGSPWNSAGTWEEKNLNKWATNRITELLQTVGSLDFPGGKAEITHVSKCVGDAFLVTVRNKKRVGYSFELTLQVKGEWVIKEETKEIKGHIDIPEFSFGELDDLELIKLEGKRKRHLTKAIP
ncbi:hypothetical protein ACFE04_014377 [Oxalis oulophora]